MGHVGGLTKLVIDHQSESLAVPLEVPHSLAASACCCSFSSCSFSSCAAGFGLHPVPQCKCTAAAPPNVTSATQCLLRSAACDQLAVPLAVPLSDCCRRGSCRSCSSSAANAGCVEPITGPPINCQCRCYCQQLRSVLLPQLLHLCCQRRLC
jgi:hypothetical protein